MKIAAFALSTLALVLSHSSIIAAATAPDAVSLVEENTEERATAQVPGKHKITFDEVSDIEYYEDYTRNDATGIYFNNTVIVSDYYFGSLVSHSNPNFGYPSYSKDSITMECYGGIMRVKSVRLICGGRVKLTITGYHDDAKPVVEKVAVKIGKRLKKAKMVRLGKKFKKVSFVTFEQRGDICGLDDIQVKIRANRPCMDRPSD
mmetsp:Transcript_6002/g.5733  ORF Transcript_6002/g.5733 Transcript_6002/m.5733 type:complete len:204 (-) Transcript_6002:117-728(-)|eukprot:CAMPEP_0197735444 /NCGR_PEP_ID=MMETSP1435-20131217/710_1 /TAXON_ID=426625 /ORGANISM="Chaetoceros brevis, Strain CCMP164" /LENGTH=203 /DNA_ID=CAMNT_0043323173 /DNA_START=59 /DNA_END=670 /DNA_ORIENTATION=+